MGSFTGKTEICKHSNNCCEIAIAYMAEICGFDVDEAKERLGEKYFTQGFTCSALKSGTYALCKYSSSKGYDRDKTKELIREMYERFRAKHGSIFCSEISKNKTLNCAVSIDTVVDIVHEIIAF